MALIALMLFSPQVVHVILAVDIDMKRVLTSSQPRGTHNARVAEKKCAHHANAAALVGHHDTRRGVTLPVTLVNIQINSLNHELYGAGVFGLVGVGMTNATGFICFAFAVKKLKCFAHTHTHIYIYTVYTYSFRC